jgi:hypothetical protein
MDKKTLVADLEEVFLSLLFRVEWSYELSYECFYSSNKCMLRKTHFDFMKVTLILNGGVFCIIHI